MKFAKVVFLVAGIVGVLEMVPLYFMFDLIGKQDPPGITHPGFYYGFVGVTLAWQIAFLVIARDPSRFRMMMIRASLEKFSYGIAIASGDAWRTNMRDLGFAGMDLMWGVLFAVAYWKTKESAK